MEKVRSVNLWMIQAGRCLVRCASIDNMPFDGGQFAQIGKATRRVMTPFLYLAIKSLYGTKGGTLKSIMGCGDDAIKPCFIAAGRALQYGNLRRQLSDSLEDRPFPPLPEDLQRHTCFEFGSIEEHMKYRSAVMRPIRAGISLCSRAATTCSIRSATRRALRAC